MAVRTRPLTKRYSKLIQPKPEPQRPPVFKLSSDDGYAVTDLPAQINALMYFPQDEESRKAFHYGMAKKSHESEYLRHARDGVVHISKEMFSNLVNAKSMYDLGKKEDKIIRNGFLTGHWLAFRVWAAKNQPDVNTTDKWSFYLNEVLLPQLKEKYGKEKLPIFGSRAAPINYRQLVTIRKEFFSVAHFWAAACSEYGFERIIPTTAAELRGFRDRLFDEGNYPTFWNFLSLAESYRQEAEKIGFYDRLAFGGSLDVWRLEDSPKIQEKEIGNHMPKGLPTYDNWGDFQTDFIKHDEK